MEIRKKTRNNFTWPYNMNRQDVLFSINFFNSKPLYVSNRIAAHNQEDQFCVNSNWNRQRTGCC